MYQNYETQQGNVLNNDRILIIVKPC